MRLFVTGGSGFLGGAVLRLAREQRLAARALARSEQAAERVREFGAEPASGDLRDAASLTRVIERNETVVHCAAHVALAGRWADFAENTVAATKRLAEAAVRNGARRFVFISSAGVYVGLAPGRAVSAERDVPAPAAFHYYARAKLLAEHAVRAVCEAGRLPWVILRMGFLYGPNNAALVADLAHLQERRKLRVVGNGENRIATLFVRDAADAILRAAEAPAARGRILDLASDERVTQREFLDAHLALVGLPAVERRISRFAGHGAGWLIEHIASLAGAAARISRSSVELFGTDQRVDASAARRLLGWHAKTGFAEGMRQTRAWHESDTRGGLRRTGVAE